MEVVIQGEVVMVTGLEFVLIVARTATSLNVARISVAVLLPINLLLFSRLML